VVTGAAQADGRQGSYSFNQGWLFGGEYASGCEDPGFDDSGFTPVTLPHTVVPLSWGNWDNKSWEKIWIYRKHIGGAALGAGPAGPAVAGGAGEAAGTGAAGPAMRVLAVFDGVMVSGTAVLNGTTVGSHAGGYLPWTVELTGSLLPGDNVLAVVVDSRWLPVPPGGARRGAKAIDYLQPGGIYRDVTLRIVPPAYVSDVFARPVNVLGPGRRVDVQATIDAAALPSGPGPQAQVSAELLDGPRLLATATASATITAPGSTVVSLSLDGFGDVTLWSPDEPKLYTARVTVTVPGDGSGSGIGSHAAAVRTGFREAIFRPDGFYLNGQRLKIFGLNRHQLFPYAGLAVPARLQRRDAEVLKHDLNCNMVRCSHYPQSPHFLDACDELGLMVWQEPPGWQYIGGAAWQQLAAQNVTDMIVRDRSRPSVIVWATRLNETPDVPALYQQTRALAHRLDGSRQTAGATHIYSRAGWAPDVFGYDDYGRPGREDSDGRDSRGGRDAVLKPPLPEVPYLVSESVGSLAGAPRYRWTDPGAVLAAQARLHARAHHTARAGDRYAGLLGWCAVDYQSRNGGNRLWRRLKWGGVLDTFRVPKFAAGLYASQADPAVRPVIAPAFFWDFGPGSSARGPGAAAMIATNCDRLDFYVGGALVTTGTPDWDRYGGLAHPPVFADLTVDGAGLPELLIAGYVGGRLAATLKMSADPSGDRLAMTADHAAIEADGSDATRITFRAVDAHGNPRPRAGGEVTLSLLGPGRLAGDNPFDFGGYGGVGGAFVRSLPGLAGLVTVTAWHATLGRAGVRVRVAPVPVRQR
jgi:beta-galactosidase